MKLTEQVERYWENTKRLMRLKRKDLVETWNEMKEKLTQKPCFKYRPSRPRYPPISPFLPDADTIWENRSPYHLQKKTADI